MLLIAFIFLLLRFVQFYIEKNESNYLCGSFFCKYFFGYKYQYLKTHI